MLGNRPTLIGRLRVRAGSQDPLLTQLRIGRLLNPIELRPDRLPSSAILCIRTLRDPLPGSLRLDHSDVHPPPAWQQALSAMLDRLVSNASRPARDAVPANAEAVVFLDRSELLACLASDWCEGSVMTRWWWQSLLKQGAASQVVKELWRRTPEYVPAALQQLATRKKAADFVRTLSDAEAHYLLRGVVRSFALHSLLPVLDVFASPTDAQREPVDINQLKTARQRESDERLKTRPDAPWRPWVPESDAAGLRPEQELFLGVALMLQRAPVKVRAASFHTKVRDWQQEIAVARAPNIVGMNGDARGSQTTDRQARGNVPIAEPLLRSSDAQVVKGPRTTVQVTEETGLPPTRPGFESIDAVAVDMSGRRESSLMQTEEETERPDLKASQINEEVASSPRTSAKMPSVTTTDRQALDSLKTHQSGLQQSTQSPQTMPALVNAAPAPDEAHFSTDEEASQTPEAIIETETTEEWIETQLGGLFYLINLALFLGLYADFTTPDEPGLQLNVWDFVALIGSELVGEHVQSDPAWGLLARLAKREEEDLPGGGFEPEDEWRLPAEWLQPFSKKSSARWSWHASGARLRLFHPDGFVVLDILRDAPPGVSLNAPSPVAQLQRELKAYEGFEFQVSSFELSEDPALKQELETRNSKLETWVKRLLPYVRARLRKALGLTEPADPGIFIYRHRARVCVTPTHVDLFFRLAELPIEIRLAGLDRNPGWVPAAGRFIAFHFE